jgi:gamma-glutamyl:cysteine ligase YbdK (ATP-grasp superfamily)
MAAGPTVIDTLANMAFFFGAVHQLAQRRSAPEQCLPFSHVKDNFYHAARSGLDTQFVWLDGNKISALQLLGEELLPMARTGLEMLNISSEDIDLYTGIIEKRIQQACNGANWQKAFVEKYGADMTALTKAYVERQASGTPVHNWDL